MLYIVPTPIGNLEDITLRALRILKEVNFIAAEDTRVTKKLLSHYQISKPLVSLHEHSNSKTLNNVLGPLEQGKSVAYVTDAGTPAISDPGSYLVSQAVQKGITVVPLPGASSLTTFLCATGIRADRFLFLGFLPRKKGRTKTLFQIEECDYPVVFFESPYRIQKTLEELSERGKFYGVVGRELTKTFETFYRGTLPEILEQFKKTPIKGEFAAVITKLTY